MNIVKQQKKRITPLVREWRERLGLTNWNLTHHYHDGTFHLDDGSNSDQAVGACFSRWQYQTIKLDFNAQQTARFDDDELREIVIHELMHAMVNEMRDPYTEWTKERSAHEERVVTMLTNAIIGVATSEREPVDGN